MRDEPRPHSSTTPEPSSHRPSPRGARHPALRPRLGDDRPGDIGEEDLRAFSPRPRHTAPTESQPQPGLDPPRPGARKAGRGQKSAQKSAGSSGAPGAASDAAQASPASGAGRKMVRRNRGSGRARWKKFALLVLLPCTLAGAAGWAMTTPRLAVSGVDVIGVQVTPEDRVQPIWAALEGQNWLRADVEAAGSRLSRLPTVRSAKVSRAWNHWPPRLSVLIQERSGWLRLGGGGSWWIVDREGVAFRRATRQDREMYAITSTDFDPEAVRAGQKVPAKIWDGVHRLGLALDQSARRDGPLTIRRAYLDRDNMASLRLQGGSQDGLLVRLGDGLWPQKMERARRALLFFDAAGRRAQSLNLVSFSMPTWTPLQPRPAAAKASSNTPEAASTSANPSSEHPSSEHSDETPANDASNAATTTASTTPKDRSNTARVRGEGTTSTSPASATPASASPRATSGSNDAADSTESGADGRSGFENQAAEDSAQDSKDRGAKHRAEDGAQAAAWR